MIYENWLYTGALSIKSVYCNPLRENLKVECLVLGGGFAGLHAAFRLADAGKKVVLLEKRICGGSSSGQSGGFLTPESEEDMQNLIASVGIEEAKKIYDIPLTGVSLIVDTIKKNSFNCDLRKQDSLYLSIKKSHDSLITEEAETRKEMGLPYEVLDSKGLKRVHPGKSYRVGLKYPGSYGINSFAYTQEMKNLLLKKGVRIFEDSEVHRMDGNTAFTHLGSVTAKNIFICIDKMRSEFNEEVSKKYYHIQTYVAISEPLSESEMKAIYPQGEMMCWDSRWTYSYYRPVADGRLLLGGSSPFTSYLANFRYSPHVINKTISELKDNFPALSDVKFSNYWGGLTDVTKDLVPIADDDSTSRSIYYALGCAGLPWAAFCGDYIARRCLNPGKTEDLSKYLGMRRKYFVPDFVQRLFGKKVAFAVNHLREMLK